VKNIILWLLFLCISISFLSASERSIASPKTIAKLKNGKYSACVNQKRSNFYDESQTCFSFLKQGNNIKGGYEVTQEGPVVCVKGTITNNIITGSVSDDSINSAYNGVEISELEELRSKLPKSKLIPLTTYLQVAEGRLDILKVGDKIKTNPHDFYARVTYAKARLDLDKFKYISPLKGGLSECSK
jgi:hypothetical protein